VTTPPPAYAAETLSALAVSELIDLLTRDEDRAPRNAIDECARRGEEMVRALEELCGAEGFWKESAALGEWWMRAHAAMILGLIASERAGHALVSLMRRLERAKDEHLQGWLSGYWPAFFRNKPQALLPPLQELAQDRGVDWYMRIQAIEAVLAFGERGGAEALEAALDWAAAIAADGSDEPTLRAMSAVKLLDFPRDRHRALLDRLAAEQTGRFRDFDRADVNKAYAAGRDEPHWRRFADPWEFYSPGSIARRQERWAKEDAEEPAAQELDEDLPFEHAPEPHMRDMPKVGRNDPCPCGSGKKYKRCCLNKIEAAPVEDLAWRRLRRLLDEHQKTMLRFFRSAYGVAAIDEAWRAFIGEEHAAFDPESPHLQVFMPWLFHFWSPDPEKTTVRDAAARAAVPSALYLRRTKRVDPLLRAYLESCLAGPLTVYEVLRAEAGEGFLLRDLFTLEERQVVERSASIAMDEGDLIFGQIGEAGGVAILEACQGVVVPPIHKIEVLAFRRRRFAGEGPIGREHVRTIHAAIVTLYREIARRILEPGMPQMQNTDGEALSPRRVVFDVPSAQAAFDALKHLALGASDAELLQDAARDAGGSLARARFNWLKQGNAQMPAWENTVLGSIEIDGTRLIAEVNSEERERRFRAIISEALGERARYRATEIQSLERMLAEAPALGPGASEPEALAELPEVKAKIAEMMASHYDQWVNEKIPALGGRTPLEAMGDSAGREAVEALVAQIERDGGRTRPPLDPDIPRRLRERLGLR
jgi:SEC-C motif/Protein of unknown function (DUF2384)